MSDIIAASGLSAGAIYGHYASKEELFFAAAQQVLSARSVELDELRADHGPLPPGEIIAALIDGMRREDITPNLFLQVWAEAAIDPADPRDGAAVPRSQLGDAARAGRRVGRGESGARGRPTRRRTPCARCPS